MRFRGSDRPDLRETVDTPLHTDHYELTMVDAARTGGVADRETVFEVFARELPPGRRYGIVAGTERVVERVLGFRFSPDDVAWLRGAGVVSDETGAWLEAYRFRGTVLGYCDGEPYFPHSPVLTVRATFAEAVVLETVVLSILNHDSAVAGAAARMRGATRAALLEFGGRRTHEVAAVAAARSAYVCGFDATSNLAAGRRYGIPTTGTAAHAFTLLYREEELEELAFRDQIATLGPDTTLLVDTYDTATGIRRAVESARSVGADGPGAVRLDSGDLLCEARRARALLDELGAHSTRIVCSGDLDEFEINRLERDPEGRAPVDVYGVGTRLVTGSGHPTSGFVYKLVAAADRSSELRPVAKHSSGKETTGAQKTVWRRLDHRGTAVADDVRTDGHEPADARLLQHVLVADGEAVASWSLDEARADHLRAIDELPDVARELHEGEPVLPTWRNGHEAPTVASRRSEAP